MVNRRLRNLVAWAQKDRFSEWNCLLPWRRPIGILALAAGTAALCGFFLDARSHLLCGLIVAVAAVGVAWPWICLQGLAGVARFDVERAVEQSPVRLRATLRNRWPWSIWGVSIDGGFDVPFAAVGSIGRGFVVPRIPGRSSIDVEWTFHPPCRGIFPNPAGDGDEIRMATGFPFGLWSPTKAVVAPSRLIVHPKCAAVPSRPAPSDSTVVGSIAGDRIGTSGDVLGLRPYRIGDSLRKIHWRQTAKHDRLIFAEQQDERTPSHRILLDLDPAVHIGDGPDGSRETAIRIAAGLADAVLRLGVSIRLQIDSDATTFSTGPSGRKRSMDFLANLPWRRSTVGVARPGALLGDSVECIVTTNLRVLSIGEARRSNCIARWIIIDVDNPQNVIGFTDPVLRPNRVESPREAACAC